MTLAYQRWKVALAVRDMKPRTLEEIQELVGFDPEPCLLDEKRGSRNFARRGDKWRLTPKALECLEYHETTPRKPFKARPKKKQKAKRKQKRLKIL